jgi:hypothetical protein
MMVDRSTSETPGTIECESTLIVVIDRSIRDVSYESEELIDLHAFDFSFYCYRIELSHCEYLTDLRASSL